MEQKCKPNLQHSWNSLRLQQKLVETVSVIEIEKAEQKRFQVLNVSAWGKAGLIREGLIRCKDSSVVALEGTGEHFQGQLMWT